MKRVAYITDLHLDEEFPLENGVKSRENLKRILEDVAGKNINEIICGGDIGTKESYPWFFDLMKDFRLDLTLGNHDRGTELVQYFDKGKLSSTGELYYAYEDQHYKYIFLDSSAGQISEQQFLWLSGELVTERSIALFIHHPVLEVRTAIDKVYPLHGRDRIKQALQNHNNKVTIFCGHYHMDDEQTSQNLKQLNTPAISFQIDKHADSIKILSDSFGYRIITFDQDQITTEVLLYRDNH